MKKQTKTGRSLATITPKSDVPIGIRMRDVMLEKFDKFEWLNGINCDQHGVGVALVDGKFCHVQVGAYADEDSIKPLTLPQTAKLLRELNSARHHLYLDQDYSIDAEDAFLKAIEEFSDGFLKAVRG